MSVSYHFAVFFPERRVLAVTGKLLADGVAHVEGDQLRSRVVALKLPYTTRREPHAIESIKQK
jgi:hypothetical protein